MAVQVHVWDSNTKMKAAGHSSISLSDGTYISFWPEDGASGVFKNTVSMQNKLATSGKINHSLEVDIKIEGFNPKTFMLKGFNETEISKWWNAFINNNEQWHLTNQNCCTVVYKALCAGNSTYDVIDPKGGITWCPNLVIILAEDIQSERHTEAIKAHLQDQSPLNCLSQQTTENSKTTEESSQSNETHIAKANGPSYLEDKELSGKLDELSPANDGLAVLHRKLGSDNAIPLTKPSQQLVFSSPDQDLPSSQFLSENTTDCKSNLSCSASSHLKQKKKSDDTVKQLRKDFGRDYAPGFYKLRQESSWNYKDASDNSFNSSYTHQTMTPKASLNDFRKYNGIFQNEQLCEAYSLQHIYVPTENSGICEAYSLQHIYVPTENRGIILEPPGESCTSAIYREPNYSYAPRRNNFSLSVPRFDESIYQQEPNEVGQMYYVGQDHNSSPLPRNIVNTSLYNFNQVNISHMYRQRISMSETSIVEHTPINLSAPSLYNFSSIGSYKDNTVALGIPSTNQMTTNLPSFNSLPIGLCSLLSWFTMSNWWNLLVHMVGIVAIFMLYRMIYN